ncbi:hypothetical protein SB778_38925, partial [Paraburkholderia sp. SIMBA_050]
GAAGGLGLQALARRDSTRICVFGTGVQARAQLDRTLALLPQRCAVQYVSAGGAPDPAFESAFSARCDIRAVPLGRCKGQFNGMPLVLSGLVMGD